MLFIYNLILRCITDWETTKHLLKKISTIPDTVIQLHPFFQCNLSLYAQTGELDFDDASFPDDVCSFTERRDYIAHLIEFSHSLGMRVICDVVPNHLSATTLFRSIDRTMFEIDEHSGDFRHPVDNSGRIYEDIIKLDYDNPAVFDFMQKRIKFLLDLGCDGMRIDMATYLRPGVNETLIRNSRAYAKDQYNKELLIVGESFGADIPTRKRIVSEGVDWLFHSSFWFPLDEAPKSWLCNEINAFPESAGSIGILANHDTDRLSVRYPNRNQLFQACAFHMLVGDAASITTGDEFFCTDKFDCFHTKRFTRNEIESEDNLLDFIHRVIDFKAFFGKLSETRMIAGRDLVRFIRTDDRLSKGYCIVYNRTNRVVTYTKGGKSSILYPYGLCCYALDGTIDPLLVNAG